MNAIGEIRAGRPGETTLLVAMRAGARVVGDFPPPEGFGSWTAEAIEQAVSMLFEAKPHLLSAALANGVANDDALEAYVLVALRRHLIDQAKMTEVGKMRRRFEKVLGDDPRFEFSKDPVHTWSMLDPAELVASGEPDRHAAPENVWSGDLDVLRAAGARVRGVYVTDLNRSGPTPKKIADPIRAIAEAVLTEASAAVPAQDLARVVLERLFPGEQPVAYLDEPGRSEEQFASGEPGPDFLVTVEAAAASVFAGLTDNERALVPHLGATPEKRIGVLDDVGPAETEALTAALVAKIALAVVDDADAEQVVLALLHMSGRS